jgi:ComEC/Rec2-related protein
MQRFENRKFLLLLLLFALIFTAYATVPFFSGTNIAVFAAVLVLAAAILGGVREFGAKSMVFVFLALCVAFSSVFCAGKVKDKNQKSFSYANGAEYAVRAEITLVSYVSAYDSSYRVRVLETDGESCDFYAVLELSDSTSFAYGDIISFDAVFESLGENSEYLHGKNIFVRAVSQEAHRVGKAEKDIEYYVYKANTYLSDRMVDLLGNEAGGFCAAIVLGNRSYVSAGVRLDFARTGISHLLALSGLHLSIIAQTLDFILRGFVKKRTRNIVLIVSVFAFAVFTGLSVSVLRAAIMLAFIFVADTVGEESDSLTALFAAVCLILLFNGNAVYDVAFHLSVFATLGIILVRPAAEELFAKWQKPKKKKLLRALHGVCKYFYGILTMTVAATFFTLPVIYFAFGKISVVGVFSNFIFLPLASLLLIACVLFVPLSFVPYVYIPFKYICGVLAELLLALAEGVSELRGIYVSLNYPFSPYIFSLLLVVLFLCIFVRKLTAIKIGALLLSFLIAFFSCFGAYKSITEENMHVILGSQGTREFVAVDAGEENYVFDISTGGYSFIREGVECISDFAGTEIDNLVLTHYHIYHENSIYRISDVMKIRNVLLPVPETADEQEAFAYITALLSRLNIGYELYTRGEVWQNGEVSVDFAPRRELSRSVKPIAAFSVKYKNYSFAYIESAAFESCFDYSAYTVADTVFVGAHGPARKFSVSAYTLAPAGRVVFAEGAIGYFRDTEYLAQVYEIADYGGKMSILYKE